MEVCPTKSGDSTENNNNNNNNNIKAVAVEVTDESKCPRLDKICDSVLDAIGGTPLIRLNRVGSDLACELLVKCEFFNAGGSVKDRIGRQMVLDAERTGRIKPGDTLIEPTSGNTGIGLALACAVKGYRCLITMPEKMSKEKVDVLKALGAEIIRTPTEAAYDAPDSHISVARRLQQEIPNSHILDQYSNPSNPDAHYHGTAEELIRQCNGKIDMVVCGAGTGGTITGIARRLKEHNPECIVVGVDPEGSILAVPDSLNNKNRLESYLVEGIGYDFIPDVLDRSLVDVWYKSNDEESLLMMRQLIREEGLLCGGSCGAAVACALKAAHHLGPDKRVVILMPDSVRNYMTKALSDDWMADHNFCDGKIIQAKQYQSWWAQKRVCDLPMNTPLTITSDVSCKDAISLLKQEGFDMVPVLQDGGVIGVVTEGNMTNFLLSGRCQPETTVAEAGVIYKGFKKFSMNDSLADIARALDREPFVLIVTEQRCYSGVKRSKVTSNSNAPGTPNRSRTKVVNLVSGIATRIDLLDYISSEAPEEESVE